MGELGLRVSSFMKEVETSALLGSCSTHTPSQWLSGQVSLHRLHAVGS